MRNNEEFAARFKKLGFFFLLSGIFLIRPALAAGPPAVITVQPLSQSVLKSSSVIFTVVATSGTTMTYQWRKNAVDISGATSSSYTILSVVESDAAAYSVKIVNGGGTVYSSNATLTVLVPVGIATQPTNQTKIQGQNASFSVVPSGTPPFTYQWSFSGTNIPGATSSSLTRTNVQTNNAGGYRVVVANTWGTATSQVATLTVHVPPGITTQPANQTNIQGQTASFSVVASGTPLNYQWRFNGSNLAGATAATLNRSNAQPADVGNYTVVITNLAGSTTSTVATLTVIIPPSITTQPQNQITATGLGASFSVVADGTAPFSYQWQFNGAPIPAATNNSYAVTNAQLTNAGVYSATVWNVAGMAYSSNATLTVAGPPVAGSGSTVSVSATNVTTRTWSHTVSAGNNRILIVGIALADTGESVTNVTFGGTALTRIASTQSGNTVEMWSLLAPPIGTANIVATWTGNKDMAGWSGTFTNVDQVNPIRNSAVASGDSTTPGITVASAAGDLVVDTLSANGDAGSLTNGAGQTQIGQNQTGTSGGDCWGASSHKPGTSNVTMSWSTGAAKDWGIAAASLQAAPALQADIATTSSGPTNVMAGANLTYSITVTNVSSVTASNIIVTDTLPPDAVFFSASDGGASSNGVVTWPAFNLAGNAFTNFTLTITAPGSGTLTNTVSSTASTYDPDAANNDGSANSAKVVTAVAPQGSPGLVNTTNVISTGVASNSWAHTVSPGENRILVVGISLAGKTKTVSSVTYGGTPLTRIVQSAGKNTAEMWCLLAPPVGTANIQSTLSGSEDMAGWSGTFTNVAQTNPIRNFAVASSNSTTPSITVASAAGDLVVDTLSANGDAGSLTNGAGQTQIYQDKTGNGGGNCWAAASREPGADNVTMSWSTGGAKDWDLVAVALKAARPLLADVATTISGPASVIATSNLTYTITVTNTGPAPATNLVVSDPLPAGSAFVSASGGGTNAGGIVTWLISSLATAATTNLTLTVIAPASGTLTNTVSSTAATSDPDASNNDGTATAATVLTLVQGPPTMTQQPQPASQAVIVGQAASFSAAAAGVGPLSYQWSLNGATMAGATNPMLTLTSVGTNDAGNYTVVVSNPYGSVTSTVATLTVLVPPSITTQPGNRARNVGQNTTFTVVAAGTSPLSYQWRFKGTNLAGATNSSMTLINLQTNHAGGYSVVVTNIAGSITSAVATLTIRIAPTITTQPQSQTVTQGSNVVFFVVASGTAPFAYQWTFNGSNLAGATNSTLSLNNVLTNAAGSYAVTVTNLAGSATSATAILTVNKPPLLPTALMPIAMTSNGMCLELSAPAGATYVTWATSDLATWTPIATNAGMASPILVIDEAATNHTCRFYRVEQQ